MAHTEADALLRIAPLCSTEPGALTGFGNEAAQLLALLARRGGADAHTAPVCALLRALAVDAQRDALKLPLATAAFDALRALPATQESEAAARACGERMARGLQVRLAAAAAADGRQPAAGAHSAWLQDTAKLSAQLAAAAPFATGEQRAALRAALRALRVPVSSAARAALGSGGESERAEKRSA